MKFNFEKPSAAKQETVNPESIPEYSEAGPSVDLEQVRAESKRLDINLNELANQIDQNYGSMGEYKDEMEKATNTYDRYADAKGEEINKKIIDRIFTSGKDFKSLVKNAAALAIPSAAMIASFIATSEAQGLTSTAGGLGTLATAMAASFAINEKIKNRRAKREQGEKNLLDTIVGVDYNSQ